jgi:outer membrane protein
MTSKLFRFVLPAVLLTVTSLAQTGNAAAAPVPTSPASSSIKIGTINMQAVILNTTEGQRDFDALQKKFQPKQTELQALNKEIDDLKKQLDAQGSKMNDDARATLVKSIETKQKSFQRSAEDAQNDYDGQKNEIVQKILTKLAPIIQKYAQDNAYGLIVDVSNPWPQGEVLWAGPSVDISKAIVDEYNSQNGASSSAPATPAAHTAPAHTPPAAPSATPRPKPAAPKP